mmetsp:Transcript_24139/g.66896  ORF Transcript_24139/g.66896 Transcript_24139/m.66896 type:complete len:200 (+) Transcript_24139:398-997(+)
MAVRGQNKVRDGIEIEIETGARKVQEHVPRSADDQKAAREPPAAALQGGRRDQNHRQHTAERGRLLDVPPETKLQRPAVRPGRGVLLVQGRPVGHQHELDDVQTRVHVARGHVQHVRNGHRTGPGIHRAGGPHSTRAGLAGKPPGPGPARERPAGSHPPQAPERDEERAVSAAANERALWIDPQRNHAHEKPQGIVPVW